MAGNGRGYFPKYNMLLPSRLQRCHLEALRVNRPIPRGRILVNSKSAPGKRVKYTISRVAYTYTLDMKVSRTFSSLTGSFMVLVLLPYVLVASFQLISFNMPYRLIQRSLPGSLGTAPEGAVGYQQPPGPVINNAQPTVTSATAAQEPAELNGASPVTTNPSNNVAFLTGTVTKTPAVMERTQVAIAGQGVDLTPASLFLSIVLTALQL